MNLRSIDRRLWVLFAGEMVISTGFSMFFPYMTIYFNESLGVSMTMIGLVWGLVGIMSATSGMIGGEIADRMGRRVGLVAGMGVRTLAFTMMGIAMVMGADFIVLVALLALSFLLGGISHPAVNAMVADITPPGKRLDAYSFIRVGGNLGFTIGVVIGGFVAMYSYAALFFSAGIAAALYAIIAVLMIQESRPDIERERGQGMSASLGAFRDSRFLLFAGGAILLFILMSQFSSTYTMFAKGTIGLEEYQIGTIFSMNGMMIVLLQIPLARLLSRYRISRVLMLGALFYFVAMALVGPANGYWWIAMTMVLMTIGEMIISPSAVSFVSRIASEESRGRYMGAMSLIMDTGAAMGPFIGGMIMDSYLDTPIVMWLMLSSFGLMAALAFVVLGRRIPEDVDLI